MWLSIHTQGLEIDAATRERVTKRLAFALGRFRDGVGRVTVLLLDVNGPRGGADKECRIVAEVPGRGRVVVSEGAGELNSVIDRGADRVGQAVRRRLDRARAVARVVIFQKPLPN